MYTVNSTNLTGISSLFDYSYTYHYSKYSCLYEFYFIHIIFCYFIFLSGLGAFITRFHEKLHVAHPWFGRAYIISMIMSTASSLLIHNTGLPLAVLISFGYVLGGMIIGWMLIICHRERLYKRTIFQLHCNQLLYKQSDKPLNDVILNVKRDLLLGRSIIERVFSLKVFHGMFMFLSWFNITGRIFASDQSPEFQCYTYPVYKVGEGNSSVIEFVPEEDPNYARLPWAGNEMAWAAGLFFGPIILFSIIGAIWVVISMSADKCRIIRRVKS